MMQYFSSSMDDQQSLRLEEIKTNSEKSELKYNYELWMKNGLGHQQT